MLHVFLVVFACVSTGEDCPVPMPSLVPLGRCGIPVFSPESPPMVCWSLLKPTKPHFFWDELYSLCKGPKRPYRVAHAGKVRCDWRGPWHLGFFGRLGMERWKVRFGVLKFISLNDANLLFICCHRYFAVCVGTHCSGSISFRIWSEFPSQPT